jgi:hypothetical protein
VLLFGFVAPHLVQAVFAATGGFVILIAQGVFAIKVLVIFLGHIKGLGGFNRGVNGLEFAGIQQLFLALFGLAVLLFVQVKNS